MESLVPGLESSRHLTQLKTEGNPVREEPEFKYGQTIMIIVIQPHSLLLLVTVDLINYCISRHNGPLHSSTFHVVLGDTLYNS